MEETWDTLRRDTSRYSKAERITSDTNNSERNAQKFSGLNQGKGRDSLNLSPVNLPVDHPKLTASFELTISMKYIFYQFFHP